MVLITLDTTRADHLGCYGYGHPLSPNIDHLAERGTLFTSAMAQAAVTPVSHASILTGLNPYNHGLRVLHGLSENRLAASKVTLAEILKDAGYDTAAFLSAFPVTERFGLQQGFDRFDADFLRAPENRIITRSGVVNTGANQRHAGETTDRAVTWLTQARKPFFLWVHYFDPHDPKVLPPTEFRKGYKGAQLSSRDPREILRAIYDMEVAYMDLQIGRLLDEVERVSAPEELVVIVVADHGEGLGDHDWWTHGVLYEEQIRVPLIIVAPSRPGGRKVEYVVRTIDIVPTIVELVGLQDIHIPSMDGTSLVPLLQGSSSDPQYIAYSDSVNMLTYRVHKEIADEKNDMLFSVRQGPWKYIHHLLREQESELYNLEDDPHERSNLLASRPRQVAHMHELLNSVDFFPRKQASPENMSAEDVERLRALGYVQ